MTNKSCPYPVLLGQEWCCNDDPCSIQWYRPCITEWGGCWDQSTCPGCEVPVYKGDPEYIDEGKEDAISP